MRRRIQRHGREGGCWVYIPLAELSKAIDEPEAVTHYRIHGGPRRGCVVTFCTEP